MAKFRARARTVDLLGRQQIASPATALHELFKNAHDAYADHVEVDFFETDGLLVVRDDGVGMTREEFEGRWLVVGTESKVGDRAGLDRPPSMPGKPARPVLGEKGVGRLAVGILGRQVLVVTRAVRDGVPSPTVVAFVHWGLFELTGIDLDEIEVPLVELDDGPVTAGVVAELVSRVAAALDWLAQLLPREITQIETIRADLSRFVFDPGEQEAFLPGSATLRLSAGGSGTQFWILPATDVLPDNLRRPESIDKPSEIEQQLIGFSDTATPDAPPPAIRTRFRHHRSASDVREILADDNFFVPGEFENADQLIRGNIDEYGTFRGTVRVFGEVYPAFQIPFREGRGRLLRCGPCRLELAYIQGNRRESTLPDDDWLRFESKAQLYGGVYVYNDGIRVLPYGNTDFDWLEIEDRRSKSARYYFFSHRRMCGAIHLTRAANPLLQEKAGREGFIKNVAYGQLQKVLQGVLVTLAAEFYRTGTERGDKFHRRKGELERLFRARERREAQVRPKRQRLKEALERIANDLQERTPTRRIDDLLSRAHVQVEEAMGRDGDAAGLRLDEVAEEIRAELRAVRSQYSVARPRIALSQEVDRDYRRYLALQAETEARVFAPAERKISDLLAAAFEAVDGPSRRYERTVKEFDEEGRTLRKEMDDAARQVQTALTDSARSIKEGVAIRRDELTTRVNALGASLAEALRAAPDSDLTAEVRTRYLTQLGELRERLGDDLERMRLQLEGISWDADADVNEQLVAAEQQVADAQARLDEELEATQLGLAVAVVSHEFDHAIREVREAIRALKPWADVEPELKPIHRRIAHAFEHIDGYLTLFTPLQRRLYRTTTQFSGKDIYAYLDRLFRLRLREAAIAFTADDAFLVTRLTGFPSAYYPVFVNLVDNAIFWLQEPRLDEPPRAVRLERDADSLLVRDSGPGVPEGDRDLVFDRGFTMKSGGRGLGLTIARDAMRAIGGDLRLDETESGACFRIVLPRDALNELGDK